MEQHRIRQKQGNGTWRITKTLSTGIYCYKFVADGVVIDTTE